MAELNNTGHKILNVAEQLTQSKGFNAFSYKDLQNLVGVKTATIHYYFPTKQDLALRMTERYLDGTRVLLESMAAEEAAGVQRLKNLSELYLGMVKEDKFCLCGMMASDMFSLPDSVNETLKEFFALMENWVAEALRLGQSQGTINEQIEVGNSSAVFLSALEGGMLLARLKRNTTHLEKVIEQLLWQFTR